MTTHQLLSVVPRTAGNVHVFSHPVQPRLLVVGGHGDVRELDASSGLVVASGSLSLPAADSAVGGTALVRGRRRNYVVTLGRGGSVGMWDIDMQTPHLTRMLKGDKLRGQEVGCVCGTQQPDGLFAYMFAARARSSTIQAIRLQPFGIAHEKVASDPSATVQAMCCHPNRPWLLTSQGQPQGPPESNSQYDNDVRIWDYSGLMCLDKGSSTGGRGRQVFMNHDTGSSGGAIEDEFEEEIIRGKLQLVAICRRGDSINLSPNYSLRFTSLAISRGKHNLLVAIGENGLLLWSLASVLVQNSDEIDSAIAANSTPSSKRNRSRIMSESSAIEIHAIARQTWGSGSNSSGITYPARVAFDEQAPLLHLITRHTNNKGTSVYLDTLSLLPLHLSEIEPKNQSPLPWIASTHISKQGRGSSRHNFHQIGETQDAHLIAHPLYRQIVVVPLYSKTIR